MLQRPLCATVRHGMQQGGRGHCGLQVSVKLEKLTISLDAAAIYPNH